MGTNLHRTVPSKILQPLSCQPSNYSIQTNLTTFDNICWSIYTYLLSSYTYQCMSEGIFACGAYYFKVLPNHAFYDFVFLKSSKETYEYKIKALTEDHQKKIMA